ncbi:MAG: DUF3471 domain-containing protein, partial [Phycisphaeraceae bacterium]|nr:DUF3471 domain-containing protein [Phycisphaeraceae bacterium]
RANIDGPAGPLGKALATARAPRARMEHGLSMGLGWLIARDGITRLHGGQTGGYQAYVAVIPDRRVGMVVLANTASDHIATFGEQVIRVAFGKLDEAPMELPQPVNVEPEVLERYPGTYMLAPGFGITVTLEDGRLMARATGQRKAGLYGESDTSFFYKVVNAKITFGDDEDGDGKADKLTLHQGGRNMPGFRVKGK